MIICRICGEECEESAELCPKCGAQLVVEETAKTEKKEMKNPVLAVTVNDFMTADILVDILNDNGIPCFRSDEQSGAMHMGFGGGFIAVDIFVDESDLERAQELYSELENSEEVE